MSLTSRKVLYMSALMMLFSLVALAQKDKKLIRQGNSEYEDKKYTESETAYRKALSENSESRTAVFNIGDALYRQKKYDDASKQFLEHHDITEDKTKKSESLYNLGNSLLMANKVKEAVDAYKGSLRLNPKNPEAKYNLAYAQDMLQKQQQQQQQQQNDKNKQDQDNQNQDKNNDQKQQDQKQQDQNQDKQQQQQQQQQQEKQQGISKEDAERILNAMENDEKNVQEKVKLAKALKAKVKTLKNW